MADKSHRYNFGFRFSIGFLWVAVRTAMAARTEPMMKIELMAKQKTRHGAACLRVFLSSSKHFRDIFLPDCSLDYLLPFKVGFTLEKEIVFVSVIATEFISWRNTCETDAFSDSHCFFLSHLFVSWRGKKDIEGGWILEHFTFNLVKFLIFSPFRLKLCHLLVRMQMEPI